MTDRRKTFSNRFSGRFGAIRYRYALAPYVWSVADSVWSLPVTSEGGIDLRTIAQMGTAGGAPQGFAFVASTQPVTGAEITRSMYVDEPATSGMQDAWESNMGYRPTGAQLRDLLWDQLTTGSDPSGDAGPKPLMPTVDGHLELVLGGHSTIKREKFEWGKHAHTNQVQAVLHRDFARRWEETNGADHCRRELDWQCHKFGCDDWKEFVPKRLHQHVPGRLPHATTITDNFDGTDGDTIGNLLTWVEDGGDWDRLSNQVIVSAAATCMCHNTSALSGSDHYAQCSIIAQGTANGAANRITGGLARYTDQNNFYYAGLNNVAAGTAFRFYKRVTGTDTQIGTDGTVSVSLPQPAKTQCSGSTMTGFWNGSAVSGPGGTDTSLASGTLTGMWMRFGTTTATIDNFEAADLAAGVTIPIMDHHYRMMRAG